jgi:hypothetical protein
VEELDWPAQGSIVGPYVFLIYINDLAAVSYTILPIIFADDTNLILAHNFDSLINEANSSMDTFSKCFQKNKSSLNVYSLVRIRNIIPPKLRRQNPLDSSEI